MWFLVVLWPLPRFKLHAEPNKFLFCGRAPKLGQPRAQRIDALILLLGFYWQEEATKSLAQPWAYHNGVGHGSSQSDAPAFV